MHIDDWHIRRLALALERNIIRIPNEGKLRGWLIRLPCQGCKSNGTTDASRISAAGPTLLTAAIGLHWYLVHDPMLSHDGNKDLVLLFNRKSGVVMMINSFSHLHSKFNEAPSRKAS